MGCLEREIHERIQRRSSVKRADELMCHYTKLGSHTVPCVVLTEVFLEDYQ